MSYSEIHTSLNTRLEQVPTLPSLQKENNRIRLGSNTDPWCRSTLLPSASSLETLGLQGITKAQGIFQVDLFYPIDTSYEDSYTTIDEIIAYFTPGTQIGNLTIMNNYAMSMQNLPGQEKIMPNYYIASLQIIWQYYFFRPTL